MPVVTTTVSGPWWATAVIYQVYPRSFADSNGDGEGDLAGVTSRLPYLRNLGVDGIWLSPFYTSPMEDGGYDVSDPCDVDPRFGTLADFDTMLAAAHQVGLKVIVDIVPNHFSSAHEWFQQALAAGPGSPERERFIFREGRGPGGDEPPNNWPSAFGGPAWTRVDDGWWYLHLFAPGQPDLNWDNPAVPDEFERIMRFWLDRGVDGFRVDVAHGMAKPKALPDFDVSILENRNSNNAPVRSPDDIRWDQEAVHDIHRRFRRTLDSYPGDRMAIGEVWAADDERLARYVRPDELQQSFNFELVDAKWDADDFIDAINRSLVAMKHVGAICTWVLGNHDVDRPATRYGGGADGFRRARAAALIELALPGAAYVYNGEELGLANVELPDSALQDPTWDRSGHTERGRDGERVPLPWSGSQEPFGFTTGAPWLPMPAYWAGGTAADQERDPDSTWTLYHDALRLRHSEADLLTGGFEWVPSPAGSLAFRRGSITVVANMGQLRVPLPAGEVLLASGELDQLGLPGDTAAWIRTA